MDKKPLWIAAMAGSLAGWAFIAWGIVVPFSVEWARTLWIVVMAVWASHPLEIPVASYRIGKERGLSLPTIVLKTLAFGFTWWLPLKQGVFSS